MRLTGELPFLVPGGKCPRCNIIFRFSVTLALGYGYVIGQIFFPHPADTPSLILSTNMPEYVSASLSPSWTP